MKAIYALGLAATCCLAAGFVTTGSDDSRELRELSRRVEKLERSQTETSQAVSRLAKSIADLEKQLAAAQRPVGDRRDGMGREQQDKRVAEIEKRLADLSKGVIELQKQVSPRGDLLTAVNKKIDDRTMKLAEWFDQYHPRSALSYFHRDEIKRIR